jgi:hypothetical protein
VELVDLRLVQCGGFRGEAFTGLCCKHPEASDGHVPSTNKRGAIGSTEGLSTIGRVWSLDTAV